MQIIITSDVRQRYVVISWDPVPGATYYKVYSSNSSDNSFSEAENGTVVNNIWYSSVPQESNTYYHVKAFN